MNLQQSFSNRILRRLSYADLAVLAPLLEPVDCPLAEVLVEQDTEITHTYFLDSGVASLIAFVSDDQKVEGGVIGREGYVTPSTLMRSKLAPYRVEMQIAGAGHRIACGDLLAAVDDRPGLRDVMQNFAHTLMVQMSCSVVANAVNRFDERLARWLLMCHDRSDSDELQLTHAFIGAMLGVRRPSVTTALHVLEGAHLISADRGYIMIRDRTALEAFAGASYGRPEADYRRLLGPI